MRSRLHATAARLIGAFLLLLVIGAGAVQSGDQDDGLEGFQSPSGNIHCMYDGASSLLPPDVKPSIRCDIDKVEGTLPARPRSCDGEWGRSYSITADDAEGQLLCTGDAVFNETWPVLDYGKVWQLGGFTCTSERTGITCFNAKRHGFTISKAERKLF